jgi:hypothetical protein
LCKNFLIRVFFHIFFSLENCTMQSLQELHLFFYFCKKLIGTRLEGFFFLCFSTESAVNC